jgi:hypothetical protein
LTKFIDVVGDIPQAGRWYTSGNYIGLASDTVAPVGAVQFHLVGTTPYTLWLSAEDDTSLLNALEMRLADSEANLTTATWKPFASTTTWDKTTVWVQYRDGAGNISDSYADTLDTVATSTVTAAFTTNASVCANTDLLITNQTTPISAQYEWSWDLGNDVSSIAPEPAPQTYSTGIYTIKLQVTGSDNVSTATHQVTVLPAPNADFTLRQGFRRADFTLQSWAAPPPLAPPQAGGNNALSPPACGGARGGELSSAFEPCLTREGTTVTVTSNETSATSWAWDFGDGATATDPTATHTYASIPTGVTAPVVHLAVQSANGCAGKASAIVTLCGG